MHTLTLSPDDWVSMRLRLDASAPVIASATMDVLVGPRVSLPSASGRDGPAEAIEISLVRGLGPHPVELSLRASILGAPDTRYTGAWLVVDDAGAERWRQELAGTLGSSGSATELADLLVTRGPTTPSRRDRAFEDRPGA